jgi:hypothetical protein
MRSWLGLAGAVACSVALGTLGACSGTSWEATRRADTVAGYHRFLRAHPDSSHAGEARQRLEYLRIRSHPSLAAFEQFEREFPRSPLLSELEQVVEPLVFDRTRAQHTQEGYREFLRRYPHGAFTERAQGNLVYLERVEDSPSQETLRWFVETHPNSDFVEGARRSLGLLELKREGGVERLGVAVRVGPGVVKSERVRQGFASVVRKEYEKYGVAVYLMAEGQEPDGTTDAWFRIDYDEVPAEGVFGRRTLVSRARVRLFHRDEPEAVWDRTFEAPADHAAEPTQGSDPTVFGNSRYSFWREFFVPVSTWPTSRTRLLRRELPGPVAAVSMLGDRAAVLLKDGSLEYLDLANMLEPGTLSIFRQERDLTRWTGVTLVSKDRAVGYGPDGAQLVDLSRQKGQRVMRWEPLEVGLVRGGARSGDTVLLAGDRGLYAVRTNRSPPAVHRLTEEPLIGVAATDDLVYLISEEAIETARAADIARASAQGNWTSAPALSRLTFPGTFKPRRVHHVDDQVLIFSGTTVLELNIENARQPEPRARFDSDKFGEIRDLVTTADRVFVLGGRGLEIRERGDASRVDAIQVEADERIERKGRFLLLTGGSVLEIVDLSPYRTAVANAAD